MGKIKIVFFGTPEYVIPILDSLDKSFDVISVVTQSPKKVGRKNVITPSPVEKWATDNKRKVIYDLEKIPSCELGVLASFGKIIPKNILNKPKYGIINIHPSSLPKLRGSSPIQATILSGKKYATVSIILLDEKMDHGPILETFDEKINSSDTTNTLRNRLFNKSSKYLIDIIPEYINGKIKPVPQNHKKATFTKEIKREDGFIPMSYLSSAINGNNMKEKWDIPFVKNCSISPTSNNIEKFVRAMNPWPLVWTKIKLEKQKAPLRLIIIKVDVINGHLIPKLVQLEGKNPVSWEQLIRGYPKLEL